MTTSNRTYTRSRGFFVTWFRAWHMARGAGWDRPLRLRATWHVWTINGRGRYFEN